MKKAIAVASEMEFAAALIDHVEKAMAGAKSDPLLSESGFHLHYENHSRFADATYCEIAEMNSHSVRNGFGIRLQIGSSA